MYDLLNQLKGARLSTYIALALNETQICLGLGAPLPIRVIAAQTRMSSRHALRAIQDLMAQDLVTPMSERGEHREKLYRLSERARSGKAGTIIDAPQAKAQAKHDRQTCVSGSRIRSSPISSKKSKSNPEKLSGSITEARRGSHAKPDPSAHVSGSATANARASSTKSKIDRDTSVHVSGSTDMARVLSSPHGSTAGRDMPRRVSGFTTAMAPISGTKSPITRANLSRSPRAHTRTRTRPRARVVVVNNTTSSLLKHEPKLLLQQQAQFEASRAVFAAVPVYGNPLVKLARTVDVDLARAWTERLPDAPKSFTDPVGYLVKHLLDDPREAPPEAWAKKTATGLFDAEFAKYVHGRPEHAQYCREHPEEVDCVCGKDWCEATGQWVDSM